MAAAEAWQYVLGYWNLLVVIASLIHGSVMAVSTYFDEDARRNTHHGSVESTPEASSQQKNDNTPSETAEPLQESPPNPAGLIEELRIPQGSVGSPLEASSQQNNDNTPSETVELLDDSPPNPVGFREEQFEPAKKQIEYVILRTIVMFFLLGTSILIFHQATVHPAVKESAAVTTGTTVNIEGAALARVHHSSSDEWKVWDPTDIAQPAVESTMFFIATRRVLTKNQTLREDCIQSDVSCRNDSDCVSWFGKAFREKGIYTGTCSNGACTVRAWCPQEYSTNNANAYVEVLNSTLNFAVLIKSHMYLRFPSGPTEKHDSIDEYNGNTSTHCIYDETYDLYCPRFNLSSIVHSVAGTDAKIYDQLITHGGIISIRLDWICQTGCELTYRFTLLDWGNESAFLQGFSSTDSEHDDNTNTRTFIRSTGIVFLIEVDGSGYRSSLLQFIVVLASTITIVGSTDTVSELILIAWLKGGCKKFVLVTIVFLSLLFSLLGPAFMCLLAYHYV